MVLCGKVIECPVRTHWGPRQREAGAVAAHLAWVPLEYVAVVAPLHQQLVSAQALPVRLVNTRGFRQRFGIRLHYLPRSRRATAASPRSPLPVTNPRLAPGTWASPARSEERRGGK